MSDSIPLTREYRAFFSVKDGEYRHLNYSYSYVPKSNEVLISPGEVSHREISCWLEKERLSISAALLGGETGTLEMDRPRILLLRFNLYECCIDKLLWDFSL